MKTSSEDWLYRSAAFRQLRRLLEVNPVISSNDISDGFTVGDKRVPFVNPQRGIFKPKEMEALLSIRTVFPKRGARVWYDDQREVHKQVMDGVESISYAFMGVDPDAAENRWLREAMDAQVPIIYFLGVAPSRYIPIFPSFVDAWDASELRARIIFSEPMSDPLSSAPAIPAERRYGLRLVKQRLHQATFREAVVTAYQERCALSGLPERALLDAAHIIADGDTELGQPEVSNGIPMSKIHHAAFDSHLIGISPDYRIRVSRRLLDQKDGPMLEALKKLDGEALRLPNRTRDYPDKNRLERRFAEFEAAN